MCIIISYGFTENGSQSSGSCTALLSSTIGAFVSIQVEAADVGKTLMAGVGFLINGVKQYNPGGYDTFRSNGFTPTYAGLYTFAIPFTGVPTRIGTYTLGFGGLGCAYIHYPTDLAYYVCYSCTTTRCTTLIVSTPPPACLTPAVTLTIPN